MNWNKKEIKTCSASKTRNSIGTIPLGTLGLRVPAKQYVHKSSDWSWRKQKVDQCLSVRTDNMLYVPPFHIVLYCIYHTRPILWSHYNHICRITDKCVHLNEEWAPYDNTNRVNIKTNWINSRVCNVCQCSGRFVVVVVFCSFCTKTMHSNNDQHSSLSFFLFCLTYISFFLF